jgi:hypothetical protein
METQNVSAQLYVKQLPNDPAAGCYGCGNNDTYLSTCVNDVVTDMAIEKAYQQQLDLSEYYKSPYVFDTMKRDFMDRTMEHQGQECMGIEPPEVLESSSEPPPPPGENCFMKVVNVLNNTTPETISSSEGSSEMFGFSKSSFGKSSSATNYTLLVLLVLCILSLSFFYLKN